MKINRENLLSDLEMVKAGLSPREFIEQSSCFVFQDGHVMTFNDEVACRKDVGINITGAIQAANLLTILEKMDDPELLVRENEKGELEFRGKRKRFAVTKDSEIFLPVDRVEIPEKWRSLPKEFTEAIGLVQHCASQDESKFTLTCIHLHPNHIEACDNYQIMRFTGDTKIKESVLVRASSIGHIVSLGMDKIAVTKSWIHFKNQQGLIYSCRKYAEDYHLLDNILNFKGHSIVIPKGLKDASDRAAVFAMDKAGDPLVTVTIKEGVIRIEGQGVTGWYEEVKKVNYKGPTMEFNIAPEILKHISEKYTDAQITEGRLKVVGGSWEYVTMLGVPKAEDDEEEEKEDA